MKNIPWIHKHYKHELNIICGLSATVVCLKKMCFRNHTVSLLYHQKPLANFGTGKTMVFFAISLRVRDNTAVIRGVSDSLLCSVYQPHSLNFKFKIICGSDLMLCFQNFYNSPLLFYNMYVQSIHRNQIYLAFFKLF